MRKNILYSSEESLMLNGEIQKNIADHLFLTCNYEANSLNVISEDAKFLTAVLNLYKFLVDSGIINNLGSIGKRYGEIRYDFKRLKRIIEITKAIRTAVAHNESEHSANDQDRSKMQKWMKKVIGKPEADSLTDYEILRRELEDMGNKTIEILGDFVDSAKNVQNREELIKNWENLIFQFYSSSNSRNIYKGQLRRAYLSKQELGEPNYTFAYEDMTERKIAEWVKLMYYREKQEQIDEFQRTLKFESNLSANVVKQINIQKNRCETEIKQIKSRIAHDMIKVEKDLDNNVYLYLDHYIKQFPDKIRRLTRSQDTKEFGTLQPQDIVQYLIEEDFRGVPISR